MITRFELQWFCRSGSPRQSRAEVPGTSSERQFASSEAVVRLGKRAKIAVIGGFGEGN